MPDGRLTLPSALGSGKFGTQWERVQSAYLIPCGEGREEAVAVGLSEEPQAAIATVPMTAAATIDKRRRWFTGALLGRSRITVEFQSTTRAVTGT
jgi:hypothetical protein